jgi:L-alanine-DL-glutamate epimerase-like enolase superfamily enzyme
MPPPSRATAHHLVENAPTVTRAPLPRERVRSPVQRRHPAVIDSSVEWQDWSNPILQQPYEVKDGKLHIPNVPGIGLEWDEKAVAAHLPDNF